ncbi:MAG: histidinol dehydrogenase [Planctomycetota bacterium]
MSAPLLTPTALDALGAGAREALDDATRTRTAGIVGAVREDGESALREFARELDGLAEDAPLLIDAAGLRAAAERIDPETLALLERTAGRIGAFARAQRAALEDLDVPVPGGRAGHRAVPVRAAGCYAPGGRYPLPSSVLMTAVTARAAGVESVTVATPRASDLMLAAAHVAGADRVLCAGGAHAVAALAYGAGALEPVDVIVGPGNRWVTAAKELVFGDVGIDVPAGPSELVVVCDASADPETVASDLIAQAEHDPDARAGVVAIGPGIVAAVEAALQAQLQALPTADVARNALIRAGFSVEVTTWDEARAAVDRLAPEHLELQIEDAAAREPEIRHYGGVFVGAAAAEVFGDYGVGPNHVLPTGAAARFSGGLSVLDFLRVRTWLRVDDPEAVADDCAALARLEGLEGHARSAERRRVGAAR